MLRISFAFHDNKMEYEAETGDDYERFEVEDEEVEDQRNISEIPVFPDSTPAPPENTKRKKKKEKEIFNWRDDLVYYLINKWQEEPILYNVKDPAYHDKGKRNLALERIWDGMSAMEFQPVPTKDQILEKMNGLRTYLNVQRNKVVSSKQSGTTTDAVYKRKWQFYESLSFLQDMVTPRRSYSNLDDDEETFPLRINGPRRKKTVPETPAHEMMKEATTVLKSISQKTSSSRETPPPRSKSGDEHLGETVAKLMSEVPDGMSKDLLKLEIQQLIYQTKHNSSYSGRSNFNYPPFSIYSSQPCGNSS